MNQASLYQSANQVQRHDAKLILDEYSSILQWRSDGQDSLLDVGCGSGDVLMDFVYPLLPETYAQIVGTDISSKMVSYANNCYQRFGRTQFQVLDIASEQLPQDLKGRFDHVTSFYCLHWVQNLRVALKNIYDMLRDEGGDCLLVFLATNAVYEVYKVLQKNKKWAVYMQDVEDFLSPLHNSVDPALKFTQLLNEAGFHYKNVEVRSKVFVYEGINTLKDNVKAICPFLERMPATLHDEFLTDFVNVVISMDLEENQNQNQNQNQKCNIDQQRFKSPYKLVVAYARKSSDLLVNVLSDMSIKNSFKGVS